MASPRLPLNALRAFEATARLNSMSAAAAELGVTHGAISRHVRSLETEFGVPLLKRLPKSVEPTQQGGQLAATLGDAFARMQQGVAALAPLPLTLSCSATISMHWLIPRSRSGSTSTMARSISCATRSASRSARPCSRRPTR